GITQGMQVSGINEILALDFLGPLPTGKYGYRYLLIAIDVFSKFVKLYPLRRASTQAVINRIFLDYIPKYGRPCKIHTDNGTQFRSNRWTNKLNSERIKTIFSPIRHPQPNLAERTIKEVKRCLRTYCFNNH